MKESSLNRMMSFMKETANPVTIFAAYNPITMKIERRTYYGQLTNQILKKELPRIDSMSVRIIEKPDDADILRVKTIYINGTLVSPEEAKNHAYEIIDTLGELAYDPDQEHYIKGQSGFVYPFCEGDANIQITK